MVTPTNSYRNRGSGQIFFSSFEKSSVKSEMKSSGHGQRISLNNNSSCSNVEFHGTEEGFPPNPPSQFPSGDISPAFNKRTAKIVTNVNAEIGRAHV